MEHIVIAGGGFSGSAIAKSLSSFFKVTLIDDKDYFEYTPGILRGCVEPSHVPHLQSKHTDYLNGVTIINGKIESIQRNCVIVNGRRIRFDKLCISLGSIYGQNRLGMTACDDAKTLAKYHTKLKLSKSVLITGGGPTGVELAAEICCAHPSLKVTLVHSKDRLLERCDLRASRYAKTFLTDHGVNVILDDKITAKKDKEYITANGARIKADIAFSCTGITPNTQMIEGLPMDKKGHLRVDKTLRVVGHKNIFAPGDINDIACEKTAQNAKLQARAVIENIRGGDVEFDARPTPLVISLGKHDGIFTHKGITFTGRIPSFMKKAIERKEMISH